MSESNDSDKGGDLRGITVALILVAAVFSGIRAQASWFGAKDPRQVSDDTQPAELAVQRLSLSTHPTYCSAVMIAPQWALTAGHCVWGSEWKPDAIEFFYKGHAGPKIAVDESWPGQYFDNSYDAKWQWRNIPITYQDFAVVHLRSPAPKWVKFAEVAQPSEVYVGEPAETVGFPYDKFKGFTRVVAGHCTVRGLHVDEIFSDCASSEGASGGALYVFTRSGKWKLAGITSSEELTGYTNNQSEDMIRGGAYSNAAANQFTNITYYSGEVANDIKKFNGETLTALRASSTYPVQCLTRLSGLMITGRHWWDPPSSLDFKACVDVQTPYQVSCVSNFFTQHMSVSIEGLAGLSKCEGPFSEQFEFAMN